MRHHNDNAGDWRGLTSSDQAPRYAAIAEMLSNFGADQSVLDVGCGEAVLRGWLPDQSKYTGIELSASAVSSANERYPLASVLRASAESFDADGERFSSIVFNEMLYYAMDPVGLLRKYVTMLADNGVILCSVYLGRGKASLKRRLLHFLDHRRPLSNVHCAEMVHTFMAREAWGILEERRLAVPGTTSEWLMWIARPPGSDTDPVKAALGFKCSQHQ